jgi:hypothetical protein
MPAPPPVTACAYHGSCCDPAAAPVQLPPQHHSQYRYPHLHIPHPTSHHRFVTGTCPKCAYSDARGDQCDGCGNLLNPVELINPKCKVTGTTPVVRSTRHIFLDLPQLSPKLQEYITNTSQMGGWSSNCVQVGWLRWRCLALAAGPLQCRGSRGHCRVAEVLLLTYMTLPAAFPRMLHSAACLFQRHMFSGAVLSRCACRTPTRPSSPLSPCSHKEAHHPRPAHCHHHSTAAAPMPRSLPHLPPHPPPAGDQRLDARWAEEPLHHA